MIVNCPRRNIQVNASTPSPLDKKYFAKNLPTHKTKFEFLREISAPFELECGYDYIVVPTTYDPGRNVEFLLRVCIEK